MSKAQKNFLSGAIILTVANALVKVIGAIYKIPLANLIGTVGMNYYNDAYQIYSLLYVLSTAGVPVAIAKMVSESIVRRRLEEPKKILKISTGLFAAIGILLAALMVINVEPISRLLSNDTANYCISMIAPAIFLVAVSSTIKGYFQGYKCMTPTAVYQVIEAAFKLVGLGIVVAMGHRGVTDPMILACGGVLGVSFGSFAATLFMLIRVLMEHDLGKDTAGSLPSRSGAALAKIILSLAIPISLSSAVMSVTSTLDMFLVKWNLGEYGLAPEQVRATYGAYVGATSSLFNLPPTLTVTVGIAVLPFLTAAFASGKYNDGYKNMRSSAKLVSLIAMPCALGMSVMSEPIVKLLYSASYWEVAIPTLRVLAISIFFVSFVSLTSVFLQSVGRVKTALMTMGVGAVMKLTVNIIMVRNIGIMGAPIGTFACYTSITLLNVYFIYKYMGFRFPLTDTFFKPIVCSALCCGAAYAVWRLLMAAGLSLKIAFFPALLAALVVYACCLLFFRVLSKEDMVLIPKGEKLGAFLAKKGWIHE